jgi:hypothetical protein
MSRRKYESQIAKQSAEADPLLEPLLQSLSDEQAGDILSELIAVHIEPVIYSVICSKLFLNSHNAAENAEISDIRQDISLQLIAALKQLREHPETPPIKDLCGFAAVISHRACSRWMRQRSPGRYAFKSRLYYILTRQRSFALWRNEMNKIVVGFAAWRGRKEIETEKRLKQLTNEEALVTQIQLLGTRKQADWGGVLTALFNYLGAPVEFDKLVSSLAALLNIHDSPMHSMEAISDSHKIGIPDPKPDAARQTENRIFLERLWEEVKQLPTHQRTALLLNLRDSEGVGGIALFPVLGLATLRQLAEALEMSADNLAEIWNNLPLEDARIGDILRMNRQQVINARKSARERLARRLKGFI